jgi:hypothetical protein
MGEWEELNPGDTHITVSVEGGPDQVFDSVEALTAWAGEHRSDNPILVTTYRHRGDSGETWAYRRPNDGALIEVVPHGVRITMIGADGPSSLASMIDWYQQHPDGPPPKADESAGDADPS